MATSAPVAKPRKQYRFSAGRRAEAVRRLLRGEGLEVLSRELGVAAHELSQWQERFVASGQAAMKKHQRDVRDDQIMRLKAKIRHGCPAGSGQGSVSSRKQYGLARVCRVWEIARSTVYAGRQRARQDRSAARRRPGPVGPCTDAELVKPIWEVIEETPFHGVGYRKVLGVVAAPGHQDLQGTGTAADAACRLPTASASGAARWRMTRRSRPSDRTRCGVPS